MGDSLAWALATFVLFMVGFGIRWLVLRLVNARDVAALPESVDRIQYLAEVRRMRGAGSSLQDCVQHLRGYGLRAGVASGLVLDMEREVPAAVDQPRDGEWRGYRFSYPGNWRLTALLPASGEEPGISIEAFGSAILMLIGLEEDTSLHGIAEDFREQLRDAGSSPFSRWGSLHGEGTRYSGPHARYKLQTEASIFRPHGVDAPFLVMQLYADEEAELVAPGFDLIRDTFRRSDSA